MVYKWEYFPIDPNLQWQVVHDDPPTRHLDQTAGDETQVFANLYTTVERIDWEAQIVVVFESE
jgi:hypothetical protein